MAFEVKTYLDIINAVREEVGIQTGDTKAIEKIKRAINRVYINDVAPGKRWYWLRQETDVVHQPTYIGESDTTTAAATFDSATITLSESPNVSLGSFEGYKFKTGSFDEEYFVATHTAGSASLTLASAYQGATITDASFQIWRHKIDLPVNCRETIDIWHDHYDRKMEGKGEQELRTIRLANKGREGYPQVYNTDDFKDPTPLTGESEDDRYRQVEIFPARNDQSVTLHVSYIQDVTALDADTDEPLMPISDRNVMVDGALSIVWRTLARNPEESQLARVRFERQLSAMAARVEDSFDIPTIAPNSRYLGAQRYISRKNNFGKF